MPTESASPALPPFQVPTGACDTHMHVFGPASRYPLESVRDYTPPDHLIADYRALMLPMGVGRVVILQASTYGHDNSALLESLDEVGDAAHGVVSLDLDATSDDELATLTKRGVCGLRFFPRKVKLKGAALEGMSKRVGPFGWHIQFSEPSVEDLREIYGVFGRLKADMVICRFGEHESELPAVCEMLRSGRAWVKLSHPYRRSDRPPAYEDLIPIVERLVAAAPGQLVWGSDWPHPKLPDGWSHGMPNDRDMLFALGVWVPDANLRHRILVENPAKLHRFPAAVAVRPA